MSEQRTATDAPTDPAQQLLELLMRSEEIELEVLPGITIVVREGLSRAAAEAKRRALLQLLDGVLREP